MYAGAAGRSILANSPQLIDTVLAAAPYPALTAHTLTDASALRADIDESRRSGFTISNEDVTIGIGAVGVPILRGDVLLGCISVGGLIDDILRDQDAIVSVLSVSATELGAQFVEKSADGPLRLA
jgi:Transcriptional regulator